MSIAALQEVITESRRLTIAGSSLAPGDFRLKKLIAPLEKSGEKAPVFAKVAAAVSAVVDSDAKSASSALLELGTLANAIAYTQGKTGGEGDLEPVEHSDIEFTHQQVSYRVLAPLVEALTTSGSGRLEIVRDAHARGSLKDFRLIQPAIAALGDKFPELADFVADRVLPQFGRAVMPLLEDGFDPKGGKVHVRRLQLMGELAPERVRDMCREMLDDGGKEMKVAAIAGLAGSKEDVPQLIEMTKARAKDVRKAAYRALAKTPLATAAQLLKDALGGKRTEEVTEALQHSVHPDFVETAIEQGRELLKTVIAGGDEGKKAAPRLGVIIDGLHERSEPEVISLIDDCIAAQEKISKLGTEGAALLEHVFILILNTDSHLSVATIAAELDRMSPALLPFGLSAVHMSLDPKDFFDRYSGWLLGKGPAKSAKAFVEDTLFNAATEHHYRSIRGPELDGRWLDVVIKANAEECILQLARPGHKACQKYLRKRFDQLTKSKTPYDETRTLSTMFRIGHPDALACLEKSAKNTKGYQRVYLAECARQSHPDLIKATEAYATKLDDELGERLLTLTNERRFSLKEAQA